MLVDDAFENPGGAGVIPDPLRINEGNRTPLADTKAVYLGAIDPTPAGQLKFLQASLEKVPGL